MELKDIFERQNKLQLELGYDIDKMNAFERTKYIKEYALHLSIETAEMFQELQHLKPWKKYEWSLDEIMEKHVKAKEEYIDMLHFFVIIGLGLGMTAEDVINGYMEKNKINFDRQKNTDEYKKCEVTNDNR